MQAQPNGGAPISMYSVIASRDLAFSRPKLHGNGVAYYFELNDKVCVCSCWVCSTIWPDKIECSEECRADITVDGVEVLAK
jgi:hypothetical protein